MLFIIHSTQRYKRRIEAMADTICFQANEGDKVLTCIDVDKGNSSSMWPMQSFYKALLNSNNQPAIYMTADVRINPEFYKRVSDVVTDTEAEVISFYSDATHERTPLNKQCQTNEINKGCFYLGANMAEKLLLFAASWKGNEETPGDYEKLLNDFLSKSKPVAYYNVGLKPFKSKK